MAIISSQEHQLIRATIAAVEKETSGEIYCVLARQSDDYFLASTAFVLCSVLFASFAAVLAADWYWVTLEPITVVVLQAMVALLAIGILKLFPGLRIHLVPNRIQYRRAHRNAREQFLAQNIHVTNTRTGVLLFVSLAERYAEVVADTEIDSQVDQAEWNGIVAVMIRHCSNGTISDGFIEAIKLTGELLRDKFPPQPDDGNELDDHLIEL